MASQEIAFEQALMGLEVTRGTALAAPTHYLPFPVTVTPTQERYRSQISDGTLSEFSRSVAVRKGVDWQTEPAGADPDYAPLLFNMVAKAVAAPTIPSGATLTRLWTFAPTMNNDDLKSATMWFGDPNVQVFRSSYCVAEQMTLTADASGTDGVTWQANGWGHFWGPVADPTLPTQFLGDLLIPGATQLWIDTGSDAIGTTEVIGRVVSARWTINTGVTRKYLAQGPGGDLGFSKIGRAKRHAELQITVEFNDDSLAAEYETWEQGTPAKVRSRINGGLIESAGGDDFYTYLQMDAYGPLDSLAWGNLENTNRTMQFTIQTERNADAIADGGQDFKLYAQNTRATI